jgi:hypothetical protein
MAVAELKEAAGLLTRMPVLWIPGIIGGLFAAILWILLCTSGTFFAGRLFIIFSLVLLFFTTGMLSVIRNNEGNMMVLVNGGMKYYFPVLLPQLVIGFALLLILIFFTLILVLTGQGAAGGVTTALAFGFAIPTFVFTFFFDTAAVFEDRQVFGSIQRSALLVSVRTKEVLSFFIVSAVLCVAILFGLMLIWEVLLFVKLKPIMDFTESQLTAFTVDQLIALIGVDGVWITAGILFMGVLLLLPLFYSYKACFYKTLSRDAVVVEQQVSGEYDSKGRWYKY